MNNPLSKLPYIAVEEYDSGQNKTLKETVAAIVKRCPDASLEVAQAMVDAIDAYVDVGKHINHGQA